MLTCRLMYPQIKFPFMSLLISGGHTLIVVTRGVRDHTILGTTLDDSAGEALDKAANILGLTWSEHFNSPAAALEAMAEKSINDHAEASTKAFAEAGFIQLPLPMMRSRENDVSLSFSGLKTAFRSQVERIRTTLGAAAWEQAKPRLAASFQLAVVNHICDQIVRALKVCQETEAQLTSIVCGGGVFKNKLLRER